MSKNGHPGVSVPGVLTEEVVQKIDEGTPTRKNTKRRNSGQKYKAVLFRRPSSQSPIFKYWVTWSRRNSMVDSTEEENIKEDENIKEH
ncbi:hypothetical protein HOLleu_34397 [Holothuria leucospilota]|uniref:Uncharacterized protein n=1 Tax=Holothuria leucospilota TaxID=206669 RepID=A0A9Q0YND2_HOLLE|nr:hypothetical protein HOLleu_34397 [Holothuria leucospilota]